LLLTSGVSQQVTSLTGAGATGAEIWLYPSSVLTVTQSQDTTYSGKIVGSGDGSLVKAGSGTLTLSGELNYNGSTTINAGTIKLGANNVMPDYGRVILASGAILNLDGKTDAIGSISGSGNINISSNSGNIGALTVNQSTFTNYLGVISGYGAFTKDGLGTLKLSSVNTYSGSTTISNGEVMLGISNALPANAISFAGNSKLLFASSNINQTLGTLSSLNNANAEINYQNNILTITQAANNDYYGNIYGSGTIIKNGGGTLTIHGSVAYNTLTNNSGQITVAAE
jgi:autotransporter-associated beta strand protein